MKRKEQLKHQKYDAACSLSHWNFVPVALGTWGGQGPEAAKLLAKVFKRCASWQDGSDRIQAQETSRMSVGLTLMRQVWALFQTKNFIS